MGSELKNIKLEADGEFVSFAGTDDVICEIASGSYESDDRLAMLFAAAPELLDALIELVHSYDKCSIDHNGLCQEHFLQEANDCTFKKANKAITKATGTKG
ncbi:hypothetical protein MJ634_003000 [Providencia rettgeri]|uniref:hypothetical protein n=1 Tax=Providencia rettgeri TaxID=587 RepID=UPI001B374A94|nr:hypothetical protein [Providencia rettgeri]ELR5089778.1 hypothetical protein [Providencia rettgeri]MBQ0605465.1 hypothetical protein [Providencia rettgeri]MCJ2222025.1 hypothetical protein [Providencia rettgeri]MDI7242392.1 hypothetical protein [Providencia rettgeri]MDY0819486.1 hypothetical protein [Providencia rettgeri]